VSAGKVIRSIPAPLLVLDHSNVIRYTSTSFSDFFGYPAEELTDLPLSRLTPEGNRRHLFRLLAEGAGESCETEFFDIYENPRACRVRINSIRGRQSRRSFTVILFQSLHADRCTRSAALRQARESLKGEISRRKAAEKKLRHTTYHDTLTGLPNRELFFEYHQHAFAKFVRNQCSPYAVLFLDLDDFKYINDTYGHTAGDAVIRETAGRLRSCLRDMDTTGRIGGDEFVVLIEEFAEPSQTVKVAERILAAMCSPFTWGTHTLQLGISIGIAFSEARHTEAKEVIRDADVALYHAKSQGKSRYSIFQGDLQRKAIRRMRIEHALRAAAGSGDFKLVYQPIIDLNDGTLRSFEALLRWKHPDMGPVSPEVFIPIAEDNGLISAIGRWTLIRACCDMAGWLAELSDSAGYTVSVNISPRQLQSPRLVEEVEHALRISGLPAHRLVLEITENAVIPDPESTLNILQQLKTMGVQLHLDDFGEGYSSVGLLYRFPFDTMKIDRSYVTGVMGEQSNTEVVRNIIDLGHSMNKAVIAEGIEASGEAEVLKSFNCELGQGFYFSHPLAEEDVRLFIGTVPPENNLLN
jgi:diguanylate cyclase (GGDEF)-like protein/PAS domain S-box-containing protein